MFPKKGNKRHRGGSKTGRDELGKAIAGALRSELGTTHQGVKTVMRWTGASERTVKHWFAGTHTPEAHHLAALSQHSDTVLRHFLLAAGRPEEATGIRWGTLRAQLIEFIEMIDGERSC